MTSPAETTAEQVAANNEPPPILVQSGPIPTVYAEGISQVQLGYPMSRVKLHSNAYKQEGQPNQQIRELCLELVIPTGGLIDFCNKILSVIADNKTNLEGYKAQNERAFDELFSRLGGDASAKP